MLSENNLDVIPWLIQSLTHLVHTLTHAHTHTNIQTRFQQTVLWALSHAKKCFVTSCGCWVSFLRQSLPPCVWATSNSMCGSYPFSTCLYCCQGFRAGPQGLLGKFIHLFCKIHIWQNNKPLEELVRGVIFPCDNHLPSWSFVWLEFLCHNVRWKLSCWVTHALDFQFE